jgi:2-polyprenyl-3-methyl-5-hydroxy-6-metoxy-1,4-benzoquinol methylase
MQKRHRDPDQYFKEQGITTKNYVIPYAGNYTPVTQSSTILEIGCGKGGNLLPFLEMGCQCTGIDINTGDIEYAGLNLEKYVSTGRLRLLATDIYKVDIENVGKFDFIFMKDVIEHIPDQEKFMSFLKNFLNPDGCVLFSFPPWYMPFGGHQQVCINKYASKLPYYHVLPKNLYKYILKLFGESDATVEGLIDIKNTGISIERFEKILKKEGYKTIHKTAYFINPNYEIKFGLKPRIVIFPFNKIYFLRNFYTTCMYYLIKL